ncbi:MAG: DNA-binding protein [Deltaproteobacteria bacterium]|jgi:plasmid stability protein|nr:DNA-binding protein [Deltaproteobacteria bacterium]MBT4069580.1 DNA-binding protein [Candidatus Neomarinimicrobiota bacterium]MBT5175488.1 DNA-binding protein [Candidatus Neomarinimicrobiota bacterium]
MPNLLVRNIDEGVVSALKMRAGQNGISAEAEHRAILENALMKPRKKSFAEILGSIPNVGNDMDFERIQDVKTNHVFD